MTNPAIALPDALPALQNAAKATTKAGVPKVTLTLTHLRASQINGCGLCTDMHARELKQAGESDERIWSVAAWREAPYYTDAERVALELAEALTRLSDRNDQVSDELWLAATKHYDEQALSALILSIGLVNLWNRLNVATKQLAGAAW